MIQMERHPLVAEMVSPGKPFSRRPLLKMFRDEALHFAPPGARDFLNSMNQLRHAVETNPNHNYGFTRRELPGIITHGLEALKSGNGDAFLQAITNIPAGKEDKEKDKPQKFFYGQLIDDIPIRLDPDMNKYRAPKDFTTFTSNPKNKTIPSFAKNSMLRLKPAVYNADGLWMKVVQDEKNPSIPVPDWAKKGVEVYVPFNAFNYVGAKDLLPIHSEVAPGLKKIVISLKKQELIAYEGRKEVRRTKISSGKDNFKTRPGKYNIYSKYISRRLAGSDYELPGMPYSMGFESNEGWYLHGTYTHTNFGIPVSRGCINLPIEEAKWLFCWTNPPFDKIFEEEALILEKGDERHPKATLIEIVE